MRLRLKACKKCGGDLALDDGDWLCLQCGKYYYTRLYPQPEMHQGKWLDWSSLTQREKGAEAVNTLPDSVRQPAGEGTHHRVVLGAALTMASLV